MIYLRRLCSNRSNDTVKGAENRSKDQFRRLGKSDLLHGYTVADDEGEHPPQDVTYYEESGSTEPVTDGSSQLSGAPALDDSRNRERLNGNTARRRHRGAEIVIWDTELPGFGLRCYPSGAKRWIVRYVERGRARVWTIGDTGEVDATGARRAARKRLQDAILQGLPRKPAKSARSRAPTFEAVCAVFLKDRPFAWAESTERRARLDIAQVLIPEFGNVEIDGLSHADVLRWRDGMVTRPGRYHVAVATLGAILKYAERLGHRTIGSDPTRGVPRYKQQPKQRFLERFPPDVSRSGIPIGVRI